MKLLLDTHVLIWSAGNPERLSKTEVPINFTRFYRKSIAEFGIQGLVPTDYYLGQ